MRSISKDAINSATNKQETTEAEPDVFVFYDTETSGLERDFSQILQIALVFTDDDLNILSTKKLECRRSPWTVPSPGAMLITGFSPDDLKNNAHSHYEMMCEVDDWLRSQHWPLTFVGYNSIGFDEPLLAQNLHQNLLDPGLTTAHNDVNDQSNGRADVLTLARAVATYMPGALKLDKLNGSGSAPSFVLQDVAEQNGVVLSDNDAHDAMNDVKATVGVAKQIKKAAPQLWEQMMSLCTAEGVDDFLRQNDLFTYMDSSYGRTRTAVATCAADDESSDIRVLFDLSVDPKPFMAMSAEEIAARMRQRTDAAAPQPFILARNGSQPVLMPLALSEPVLPASYDEKLCRQRAADIAADADFRAKIIKAAALVGASRRSSVATPMAEQMIENAPSDKNLAKMQAWMEEFHAAGSWKEKAGLALGFPDRFAGELKEDISLRRYVAFARRLVFEHAPEELGDGIREVMRRHTASRVLNDDPKAPYMTVPRARRELEQIERERTASSAKWKNVTDGQIRALKLYYTAIEKEYLPYLPGSAHPPGTQNQPPPADHNGQGGPGR
jgi:exodeoxyribonuclease I